MSPGGTPYRSNNRPNTPKNLRTSRAQSPEPARAQWAQSRVCQYLRRRLAAPWSQDLQYVLPKPSFSLSWCLSSGRGLSAVHSQQKVRLNGLIFTEPNKCGYQIRQASNSYKFQNHTWGKPWAASETTSLLGGERGRKRARLCESRTVQISSCRQALTVLTPSARVLIRDSRVVS